MFRQYFGLVLAAVAFASVCFAGRGLHSFIVQLNLSRV